MSSSLRALRSVMPRLVSWRRLEDQDAADYNHKMFCDKNLAETNAKVDDKKAEIENHTAKIDKRTSNSVRVKAEVVTISK